MRDTPDLHAPFYALLSVYNEFIVLAHVGTGAHRFKNLKDFTGLSERTIYKYLNSFKEKGYVEIRLTKEEVAGYFVTKKGAKRANELYEKVQEELKKVNREIYQLDELFNILVKPKLDQDKLEKMSSEQKGLLQLIVNLRKVSGDANANLSKSS